MAYDFHYTPTGTGVISGKEVLEQTEDAINDLGNTAISGVQEALDKAEQALTNSANAVDDAQTALNTANNAEGVAIQAQTDVGNLSGTVTNIGNRVTTAEGNITNLQGRMTTAEGNITNVQGRMTTAETNIGNLQTAVSTAQATANSAQQTATTARQQSYVFRYSGTAVVPNSTIAYSTIDNTDNIKSGDKIIDVDGKIFSIASVDTANQTVTVGSALIDLALDGNVVHTSGNETVGGFKQFANIRVTNSIKGINLDSTTIDLNDCYSDFASYRDSKSGNIQYYYCNTDAGTANISNLPEAKAFFLTSITTRLISNSLYVKQTLVNSTNKTYTRYCNNGTWGSWVNEIDKFVTTDTNQTISGDKTFSSDINVYNSDNTGNVSNIVLKNSKAEVGTEFSEQSINFVDKNNNPLAKISCYGSSGSYTRLYITASDSNNNSDGIFIRKSSTGTTILPTTAGAVALGNSSAHFYNVQTSRVNGLTPSSLGMPSNTYVDISGYVTDLTGGNNQYTAPENGWISVTVIGTSIAIVSSSWSDSRLRPSSGNVRMLYPVLKNETLTISIVATTLAYARFIPCQGNV